MRVESNVQNGLPPNKRGRPDAAPSLHAKLSHPRGEEHTGKVRPIWLNREDPVSSNPCPPGGPFMDLTPQNEPKPEIDLEALHKAHERKQMLAAGMLALPNLFLRSAF